MYDFKKGDPEIEQKEWPSVGMCMHENMKIQHCICNLGWSQNLEYVSVVSDAAVVLDGSNSRLRLIDRACLMSMLILIYPIPEIVH